MKISPKLITIDGDGCLFSYVNVGSRFDSSWDALGYALGLKEVWDARVKKYHDSRGDHRKWTEENAADLRGRKASDSFSVMYPIPYCEGAREFAEKTKGKIARGLLSSCVDLAGDKAKDELGLDFAYCNRLNRLNGCFDGTVDYRVPLWTKGDRIFDICRTFNVAPEEIIHIGDNENDLDVAKRVGAFIAMKPKSDRVRDAADCIANNFFEVMEALGI